MDTRVRWITFLCGPAILCLGTTPWALAQDSSPSGVAVVRPVDDGFDELWQALGAVLEAEHTPRGKVIMSATFRTATLAQKRGAVLEPAFENALAAMRDALGKTATPRFDTPEDYSRIADTVRVFSGFLEVEQYVLLSDGRVSAALNSLADSFALSDTAEAWNLAGVDVGEEVKADAIKAMARHLDQLSAHDCDQLLRLVREELNAPNPAVDGIRATGKLMAQSIFARLSDNSASPPTDLPAQNIRQMREQDPKAWSEFQTAIVLRSNALFDLMADRLRDYPAQPPDRPTADPAAAVPGNASDRLAEAWWQQNMAPISSHIQDAMIDQELTSRVRLQLLAVHAAILRRRWESGVVPDDLAALKLGPLANDPFTGGMLRYTRIDDTRYTLTSAGPPKRDENGNIIPHGERVPVTLTKE